MHISVLHDPKPNLEAQNSVKKKDAENYINAYNGQNKGFQPYNRQNHTRSYMQQHGEGKAVFCIQISVVMLIANPTRPE